MTFFVPQTRGIYRVPWLASLFAVAFLLAHVATAQVTGNISGYARDASGAAVPGAAVTAVMTERQATRTAQTDTQGFYSFIGLPPGHYQITFEAAGFQKQVQSGVELTVGQNVRVDASLSVGTVRNEVEVGTAAPLVDTVSTTLSGLIDDRRVVDLPLNGRNIMSLAAILPGVTNVSAPQQMRDARGGSEMDILETLVERGVSEAGGDLFGILVDLFKRLLLCARLVAAGVELNFADLGGLLVGLLSLLLSGELLARLARLSA